MPKDKSLTYRQLHDKLRALGFEAYSVELHGKRGVAFEYPKVAASRILLPERAADDPVEPYHVNYVLMALRSSGLLPETNPLLT
jgi:hypothetical protein